MIRNLNNKYSLFAWCLLFVGVFSACQEPTKQTPKELKIEVEELKPVQMNLLRFDSVLYANKATIDKQATVFGRQYGLFFQLYCERMIKVGTPSNPNTGLYLKEFLYDRDISQVFKDVRAKYPSVSFIQHELSQAFTYYHHYFPQKPIPTIYTYVSGFNYAVITSDSIIGVGLDMYLGKDYKLYDALQYPQYKRRKMNNDYIAVDAMRGWAASEFDMSKEEAKTLLGQMVYYGKQLYFLDAMMPDVADSIKIGYTSKNSDWVAKNENNLWGYFIEKKLLYEKEDQKIIKYIGEGPTTNGLPKEAPAQLGHWLGWQIVRNYMSNNKQVTLPQLMQQTDAQAILQASKYKPAKN